MKHFFYILIFSFVSLSITAQEVMTIAATLIDKDTGYPIAFANIGFVEKNIGTVSNENGNFSLSWRSEAIKGISALQISSIGYETIEIPLANLENLTSYKEIIYVTPTTYALDAVMISAEKRAYDRLGSYKYSKENIGYWKNMKALGGEIATRVKVGKKNTLLHDLTFNVLENKGDSLLVRVKIYDYHKGYPGKNLVPENIYYTITKKEGQETIPLKDYNIVVQDDIVVSLELVKVYGEYIYIALSSTPYKGTAFTKERSMAEWNSFSGTGIAFGLIASYTSTTAAKDIITRAKPSSIDLYWDMSLNAKRRNTEEELKLLSKYINDLGDVAIRVIKFNKGNATEKMFNISNGRSKALERYLEDTYYIGATDFSEVLKKNPTNATAALVFSHGEAALEALDPEINIPIFCINSMNKAAHNKLQDVSYVSGGHYVNLSKVQIKDALNYLQNDIEDQYTYNYVENVDKSGYVHGVVYNEKNIPLQNAVVRIKNTFIEVKTGPNGSYAINAAPGDVLSVSAFGMYKKDTLVGALKKLHVPLKTNRELLDEVYLESKTTSDKIAEEITDTPFGYKKRGAIGFSVANRFTSEDIRTEDTSVGSILKRMPGVYIAPRYLEAEETIYVFTRTSKLSFLNGGATFPVIILDDMLYDQNAGQTLPPIDPQTIDNILLLKTAQSTVRFGQLAAYGAIVIETKQYTQIKKDKHSSSFKEETPSATISGNDYIEDISIELVETEKASATYIKKLQTAKTLEVAKQLYRGLHKNFGDKVPFYLETAAYFEDLDTNFAESIRSNILALAPSNSKALRALAFNYEAIGKKEDAKKLYERILYLKAKEVQSYLDMARLSVETGDIETAEAIYTQLFYNAIPNVNATEVQEQVISALKHLVANHKSKLNYKELPKELLEVGYKEDIRIVFDWSDSATNFELQFVSPENKYFTFSHTTFENRGFLEKEMKDGFSSKEFIIDSEVSGTWLINLEHLGREEIENPTYLKYTLYRNYGLPSETKEMKVINLSKHTKKLTLDKIVL